MAATTPDQRLRRVLCIAQIDALSLLVVAGPAAIAAACARDWFAAAIGAGVAACGWLEWSGRERLKRRRLAGVARLCLAQLACLALLLLYAWHLARAPQPDRLLALLPKFTREQLALILPDPELQHALLTDLIRTTAALIAAVSITCQGGLALLYLRSRSAIATAFSTPPVLTRAAD